MKILVDADACPVKDIIISVAKEKQLEVEMFIDTSHELYSDYATITQVSKAPDAVDIALINKTVKNDIVVTQDYGVASMVLGKKAYAIHPRGTLYTEDTIDLLMLERHISKKQRRSGHRTGHMRKRTKDDDLRFEDNFRKLVESIM